MSFVEKLLNDSDRPADVTLAIKLFLGVIAIGTVQLVMVVVRHFDVRSPLFPVFAQFAIYVFSIFLLYQLAQARNWARWLMVVFLVIGTLLRVVPTLESFAHYSVFATLEVAQLGLYVWAMVLLLKKSSSEWFTQNA